MPVKITLEAEMLNDDLEPFLHWVRAFDRSHSHCHFRIMANSDGTETVGDLVEMLERAGIPLVLYGLATKEMPPKK